MEIIGRSDKVDFPELHLENLEVKVDTGAYTSSIHCHDIKEIIIDEVKHLSFKVLDPEYSKYHNNTITVSNYKSKMIKSSFGDVEERYVIKTFVILFNKEYPIELSLSNRSEMRFPVLIGRKFLNKKFMVDTSVKNQSFLSKQP
ncbi:RimK/LysX family protein [Flammeovirga sp. SubArs3]|uniref:ATP-dependent zinc protease family protein n=1 Tax=Flammeovirga sp. SubArs3 TaxID=2995316 RepID=UPI00248C8601|nr:RimK/LysX family protein [Flammeovirga sp. SubArs3]